MRAALIRLLVLTSAALLGLGLIAPAMTIVTSFGRLDGWVRLIAPELTAESETTYSLVGGILRLIREGSPGLGVLLLAFSCVFPTLKLAILAAANETIARGGRGGWTLWFAHHAGKFSMLDVLVLAMLVLAIKGLPGQSELVLGWGVWAFGGSVLLSMVASIVLKEPGGAPRGAPA